MAGENKINKMKEKIHGQWRRYKKPISVIGLISVIALVIILFGIINDNLSLAFGAVALIISIVAFVEKYIKQPSLDTKYRHEPPDCRRATARMENRGDYWVFYFAVRILNKGWVKADNVRVKLIRLWEKKNDEWEENTGINPDLLKWRLSDPSDTQFEPTIHPDTFEFCNLGYIVHPPVRQYLKEERVPERTEDITEPIFHIQVRYDSLNKAHLLPPGIYKLDVEVSCSNGRKIYREYQLELGKVWDDRNWLTKCVNITEIKRDN